MKKTLSFGIAAALLFSACQSDSLQEVIPEDVLRGTIEQPVVEGLGVQSRACFGESFAFNWQTNDKIMVLTSAGTKAFVLSGGAGTSTGTFVGSLSSGETISDKVASPYASGNTLTSTSTSMALPAEYDYGNNTTFTTIPVMLPCWAPIVDNAFTMNHLVGYIAFEISNIPAGANTFVLTTTDKRINGAFTADLTAETPIFEAVSAANDAEKTVTINFTASADITTHCFVVPVPVGTYTYEWYIKADDQLKGFGMGENVAVGRGKIKGCRVACAEIGGGDPEPVQKREYVDLGLPSGTLWATCNVGATTPEEYGDYFAWGETVPYYEAGHSQDNPCTNWKPGKTGYDWNSYKWCSNGTWKGMSKYCYTSLYGTVDRKAELDLADDAARANWGGNWRMPTKTEMDELRTNCNLTLTTRNGVNGYNVTSKTNGNSIFLPLAGRRFDAGLEYVGANGYYWTSSLCTDASDAAFAYRLYSLSFYYSSTDRFYGTSIRPVISSSSIK